jgi:hypothetical protein
MPINVADWLRRLGLEQYEPAFAANDIDDEVLSELTAEDLAGLGVNSIGHRRKPTPSRTFSRPPGREGWGRKLSGAS